jgi:acyl-coenzyme A synthetase/AMP-(fatty) acid ligase
LCRHPSIVEAAVVGVADDEYGTIVAAAVVTSDTVDLVDLDRFLDASLADYKRPATIVTVDRLPRNDNGKVVTREVRELVARRLSVRAGESS